MLRGRSVLCSSREVLNLAHDRLAIDHLAEDDVLAVEMGRGDSGNEELRAIGAGTGIGHRQQEGLLVLQLKVLILELLAVYALAAGAVASGEITALDHELLDHTVETGALVVERLARLAFALLAGAEGTEVLGGLGYDCGVVVTTRLSCE